MQRDAQPTSNKNNETSSPRVLLGWMAKRAADPRGTRETFKRTEPEGI
jgi:hypothetical protein